MRFKRFYLFRCYRTPEQLFHIGKISEDEDSPYPKLAEADGYFNWIRTTLTFSKSQMFDQYGGCDTVIYLTFLKHTTILFATLSFLSMAILLPVNITGENKDLPEDDPIHTSGVAVLTLGNIKSRSFRLYFHLVSVGVFSILCYYHIYKLYIESVKWGQMEVDKSKGRSHTVMIREVPQRYRYQDDINQKFKSMYRDEVYSAAMTPVISKGLRALWEEWENLKTQWKHFNNIYEEAKQKHMKKIQKKKFKKEKSQGKLLEKEEKKLKKKNSGDVMTIKIETETSKSAENSVESSDSTISIDQSVEKNDNIEIDISDVPRPIMSKIPVLGAIPKVGEQVDAINFLEDSIKEVDRRILEKQRKVVESQKNTGVGFVTFRHVPTAVNCAQTQHATNRNSLFVDYAPDPRNINWADLNISYWERVIRFSVIFAILCVLFLFWTVPVTFIQAITNLETLSKVKGFDFLVDAINKSSFLASVIQGILPTLALTIFMVVLPIIMRVLFLQVKYPLKTETDKAVMATYYAFLLIFVVLLSTVAGSIFNVLSDFIDKPESIVSLLSNSLPYQAEFFTQYIMTECFIGYSINLSRLIEFVITRIKKIIATTEEQKEAADNPKIPRYYEQTSRELLIFCIALIYSSMFPIILLLATCYFAYGYFTLKHHALFSFVPQYEGFQYTQVFVNLMTVAIFLYQLVMLGVLGLKKFSPALAIVPFIFFTLIFRYYIHKRFGSSDFIIPLELCPTEDCSEEELESTNLLFLDPAMRKLTPLREGEDVMIDEKKEDNTLSLAEDTKKENGESNGTREEEKDVSKSDVHETELSKDESEGSLEKKEDILNEDDSSSTTSSESDSSYLEDYQFKE